MIDMQTSQGNLRRDDPDTDFVLENRSHTYLPGHAEISGADPTTGAYRYYYTDHLGSVRQMRADDGADPDSLSDPVAAYEYDPYGGAYHLSGLALNRGYTGHKWDAATGMYFAPYRYYTPGNARWLTQDPLGYGDGPNVYRYVKCSSVRLKDPLGAAVAWPTFCSYFRQPNTEQPWLDRVEVIGSTVEDAVTTGFSSLIGIFDPIVRGLPGSGEAIRHSYTTIQGWNEGYELIEDPNRAPICGQR